LAFTYIFGVQAVSWTGRCIAVVNLPQDILVLHLRRSGTIDQGGFPIWERVWLQMIVRLNSDILQMPVFASHKL
jgi:hypothetical protein